MNADQLRLFINGAFASESQAKAVSARLTPHQAQLLARVRSVVEKLPEGSLTRMKDWRSLFKQLDVLMGPYANAFLLELDRQLPEAGTRAAEETLEQLKSVGVGIPDSVTPAMFVTSDNVARLFKTKVQNQSLAELFTKGTFEKSNLRTINRVVTGGIIEGLTTPQITKRLNETLPKHLQSQSQAIARTAIQDYNRQVKESVWADNRSALDGLKYEWVAALDSRTCPTCAPLDGDIKDKESDFPSTPVHTNCRCVVVVVDPDDEANMRVGQQVLAPGESMPAEGGYKTKKKVKGQKLRRFNEAVEPNKGKSVTYGDFLAGSNLKTQQMFFGGGQAGANRASDFRGYLKSGMDPKDALLKMTNRAKPDKPRRTRSGVERRFVPANT
jgi:SPP1 gp7 family putative phage head morphogenesis protein